MVFSMDPMSYMTLSMMDGAVAKHEEATNWRMSLNDSTYIHIDYNGIPAVHCLGAVPPKRCNVQ
jgi:hypothetical protein